MTRTGLATTGPALATRNDGTARPFLERHRRELEEQLAEWVAIASVAGDPEHADELHHSANFAAGLLRAAGFPRVELWPQGDTVAVFAEWRASDATAPTVVVYSHHDVRAAGGEPWRQTHPFTPVVRDGCLRHRARARSVARGRRAGAARRARARGGDARGVLAAARSVDALSRAEPSCAELSVGG